jgi:protein involved in polysaccharide export with SLBB domain
MPSSLIRITSIAALLLAAPLTGRSQGLAPRAVPVAPGYPTGPVAPSAYPQQERMQVVDPDKKLSAGDIVTVEIVEDKEVPQQKPVSAAGELDVPPLLLRVKVAGKTTTEAAADIKRRLEAEYYHRATVKLNIDRVSPIQVRAGTITLSGEVRMLGTQEMIAGEPLRLSSAILKAGGFTQWADQRKVQVTRQVGGTAQSKDYDVKKIIEKGDEKTDPILQDGDRIFVPKVWIKF